MYFCLSRIISWPISGRENTSRELRALYSEAILGGGKLLPSPVVNYEDYVCKQEELLSGANGERLWSYWKETLGGASLQLEVPTDKPRPRFQSFWRCQRSRCG